MVLLYRFLIGGIAVMLFAALGDVFRPKSFAGLFGAAPSIATATLALTVHYNGAAYAATEARSMMIGAAALALYAWGASCLMLKFKWPAWSVTTFGLAFWLLLAMGGWMLLVRWVSA
jgi:hypothetical protein